jgi:hypothetical protein
MGDMEQYEMECLRKEMMDDAAEDYMRYVAQCEAEAHRMDYWLEVTTAKYEQFDLFDDTPF